MVDRIRPRALNVSQFFRYIQSTIREVGRQVQQSQSADTVDNCVFRVEAALLNLQRVEGETDDQETFGRLVTQLKEFHNTLKSIESTVHVVPDQGYRAQIHREGMIGRPRFDIPQQQLSYLLRMNFTAPEIAKLIGVHVSTIRDRMRKYSLSCREAYAEMNDEELDDKVRNIVALNKNLGYRFVRSMLDSQGFKVAYHRVRQSLLRVNEAAVALRFGNTVQRRVYNVTIPNKLWHFDGNHKLIEWKFVVHGCIDGASRLITYMKVATNNRAASVLAAFQEAVNTYGVPSRVRCDRGVENGKVVEYMIRKRGAAHRPAIIGPSVHNQRIERLWVDVFQGSLCVFHDMFTLLVRSEALDRTNDVQMFALHYAFLPIIQRSLDRFREAYNKHPLTSLGCKSPEKVFLQGVCSNSLDPPTGVADFLNPQEFGIDEEGPIQELQRLTSEVQVDDINLQLTDEIKTELQQAIKPCNLVNTDMGIPVYQSVLQFLLNKGL